MRLPKISFIIPTLNTAKILDNCLKSIAVQDYPREKIEIIISDGGSTDKTLKIAEKYNCQILHNKKVLAEPGVNLGLRKAKNDICFILAADNELAGRDWLWKMTRPFLDPNIIAAFPKQVNSSSDNWLTRYINTFTDPFDHFVYGNTANARSFHKVFKILEKNNDYIIFDYTLKNHPILAFAQGFAVRKLFKRTKESELCDLLPVLEMIKNKHQIAYVSSAAIYHHSVRDIHYFIKKTRWSAANAFLKKPYGISSREKYLSKKRKIKKYLWPIYSLTIIGPLVNTIRGLVVEKKKEWLYHLPITFIAALAVLTEFIRINLFHKKSVLERQ